MDPISAIGLAASATELIKLALAVIHLCSKAARGPNSRNMLALELASLVADLSNLKQRADDAKTKDEEWFRAVSFLGGSQGPLEQFKLTLEVWAKKLEPRFGRAVVWLFSEAEINEALTRIERIKTTVALALQQDQLTLSQATHDVVQSSDLKLGLMQEDLQTLDRGIQGIAVGIMSIDATSSDERRRSIASWLSPLNLLGRHDDIYRKRHEGTNQWLLQSPEFQECVEGKRTVLRCAGIPGEGKTMIASLVVEHIKSSSQGEVAVLVMYCNYKEHVEQSITNLLASLIKQVIQNGGPLPDDLLSLYRRHQDRNTRPTLQEICAILQNLIATYDKVYIVVDALDESPKYLGVRFNLATELLGLESESCNLLFTARNYAGLEDLFPETACIDIAATEEDLRSYVDARISHSPRLAKHTRTNKQLREEITTTVVGKASGMFLLVRLHMDALEHKPTAKAVLTALHELPVSLSASYEGALERTEHQKGDDSSLARRVLYWTTYAQRPLGVLELRHALAVEDGETEFDEGNLVDEDILLSACCGLVTIDGVTRQIRLVHYTLQSYLETVRMQRFPEAQNSITESCLTYLSSDVLSGGPCSTDKDLEAYTRNNPFMIYAVQNRGLHGRGNVEVELKDMILDLLQQQNKLQRCAQIMNIPFYRYTGYCQAFPKDLSALWITAALDLVETSRDLIKQGCDVNSVDSYRGQTALHRAAAAGHVEVVKLLLEYEASLDVITTKRGFSPLREAVQNDHTDVAAILIHAGADIDSKARGGTQPIHGAAANGSVPMETVKWLAYRVRSNYVLALY